MKDRLLELRKVLGLSQTEFASRIGLSQNYWSLVENGIRAPGKRVIVDICRVYRVNPDWLNLGEGEMFIDIPDVALAELAAEYDLDDASIQAIRAFCSLREEERAVILKLARSIAEAQKKDPD